MKRVEVTPRTEQWHALRNDNWTASAAATLVVKDNAIMLRDYAAKKGKVLDIEPLLRVGLTSYFGNTPWKAWAEKMGSIPRFTGNAHTERGTEFEETVVRHFEQELMTVAEREVTVVSTKHQGLLASLDAALPASSDTSAVAPYLFPVEAKCVAFGSRQKLWDAKKAEKADIATEKARWEGAGGVWGAIMGLPYYWCQVQHQILVSEAPYGWFVAAGVEESKKVKGEFELVFPIIEKVPRDEEFLRSYAEVAQFYWEEFIDGCVEPPKLESDLQLLSELAARADFDRAMREENFSAAAKHYLDAQLVLQEAEKRVDAMREKIIAHAQKMREEGVDLITIGDALEVKFESSKGPVSWQKVAMAMATKSGLTAIPTEVLSLYTGKPSEKVKIKEVV